MNFKNANVHMDSYNHIWVDIKVDDIEVLQRAALIGGSMSVYEHNENYYVSFCHQSEISFINFYGLQITKDHFDFYLQSWGGCHCEIIQGNELHLTEDGCFEFPKLDPLPKIISETRTKTLVRPFEVIQVSESHVRTNIPT